jgi:hypothetical protein
VVAGRPQRLDEIGLVGLSESELMNATDGGVVLRALRADRQGRHQEDVDSHSRSCSYTSGWFSSAMWWA